MKRFPSFILVALVLFCSAEAGSAPPLFKEKKYFGPVPVNSINVNFGFIDGPSIEYLAEHFDNWATMRGGFDTFKDIGGSPFARIGYSRQVSPNHFVKTVLSLSYLKSTSTGEYVAEFPDTLIPLSIGRKFEIYLLSFDLGFSYHIMPPEARQLSPYIGAGFSFVFPLTRLSTDSYEEDGSYFSNPEENISQNSDEVGIYGEFGILYYVSNRYSLGFEGRYQMAQSKYYHHDGNFDIRYSGFALSILGKYYF